VAFANADTSRLAGAANTENLGVLEGKRIALSGFVPPPRRFVYVLKNHADPPRYYTGLTWDVATRLAPHNAGQSHHTAAGRPWHLDLIVEFADEARAVRFERYLKSGSGGAFARRHLR
jgi:putative endonuclease